jgi:hypothetical protein
MASKLAVTWTNAKKSARVALDGLDIVGFWDRDDKLRGSALTISTSDESAGAYESDAVVDSADATTELSIDLDAVGSHNFVEVLATKFAGVLRYIWVSSDAVEGVSDATTQASTFCKGDDAGSYADLATISGEGAYTANFQAYPDAPAQDDNVLFGAAAVFDQITIDVGTAAVYDAAGVIEWEYWDGDSWEALTIIEDGTGSTSESGAYSFEQDGRVSFTQPSDWAASTIDSQLAFWIRAAIATGKAANMTTVPIFVDEHGVSVSEARTAYLVVRDLR